MTPTDYEDLPDAIKALIKPRQWLWTPDKQRLLDDMLVPDCEDELEEE